MSGTIVDSARLSERADFLLKIAADLQSSGILPSSKIILSQPRLVLAAKAYFLLNDAFKRWRIHEGHFTETPKIAALQAFTLMKFLPFIPIYPDNATELGEGRPNEIFSVYFASAILGVEINTVVKKDFLYRLLDILSVCSSETLEPVIVDINFKIFKKPGDYKLKIHREDEFPINCLISIFELLADKHGPRPGAVLSPGD